jgi:hypothetical protein
MVYAFLRHGINIYFLSAKRDSHFNTAKIVFSLLRGNAKGQNAVEKNVIKKAEYI